MLSVKEPFSLPAEALLKEVRAFAGLTSDDIERIGSMLERSSIELLEFKALDRAVEIGYRHAVERLEQWPAAGKRMPA